MSKDGTMIVRKETAVSLAAVVKAPAVSLLDDGVRDNSYLLGFDPSQPDGESMLFAMESDPTDNWDDYTQTAFPVRTWGCKRVPLYDELQKCEMPVIRTVLIAPDGRTLAFVSDGITTSLDLIRALRGDGPYDPPLNIVIRKVKTRRGYTLLKMQPLSVVETTAKRK